MVKFYFLSFSIHIFFNICNVIFFVNFSGGKSTLTELLRQTFGNHVKTYNQDDFYFDENYNGHVFLPELNHINWELESAFNNIRYII